MLCCFESFLLQLFEESGENVTDMKNHLYGLCYQMKMFEFFGLCLAIETLAVTDQLASQSVKICAHEGKELAKNAIVTLKALKLEFEKFWTNVTVLKKLCVGKSKLKRQAQPKLRFQNENFIVAPSPSSAKDDYIQKNTKMHLTALFNVWKKDLIRIHLK